MGCLCNSLGRLESTMPTQLDIRAVAMYDKDLAPDIWQLHLGK